MNLIEKMMQSSGDCVFLLSGGPNSHLARSSMLATAFSHRLVIRQPNIEPSINHSPLNGETQINHQKIPFVAELQTFQNGWLSQRTISADSLKSLFNALKPFTKIGQRWSGILSYEMLQWTQPIRLHHPPLEGTVLGVLWLVESWKTTTMPLSIEVAPLKSSEVDYSTTSDEDHISAIEQIQHAIRAGEMYQVNYGRRWNGRLIEHPKQIFARLAKNNPAPFSAYFEAKDLGIAIASSSPEILLESDGKNVMTAPIKGTIGRGESLEHERKLTQELLRNQKERAEHRMLVDLERNDLGRVCAPGTIFRNRFDVEAYANVQHLVSQISGELHPDFTGIDALNAMFPGGSITGCPKTVVCASINELEGAPRSYWTGSAGWIDVHSGASTWNILIRTLEAHQDKKGWLGQIYAGGGITIESDPAAEVEEAKLKAAALLEACGWQEKSDKKPISKPLEINTISLNEAPIKINQTGKIHYSLQKNNDVIFVDNLDSFSYNIIHMIVSQGKDVTVIQGRNGSSEDLGAIFEANHIVIGPGPGRPEISAITMSIAKECLNRNTNVLGICLGHQAIGLADGMRLIRSPAGPVHGIPVEILHSGGPIFPKEDIIKMTRYNSLILDGVPNTLEINAQQLSSNEIMGITNGTNVHGIQFHPESVGSIHGDKIIRKFLDLERIVEK